MTDYTNRIAFLALVEHADACNRAANALGRSGLNLSVPLSSDGVNVTHYGGSASETDLFLTVLAAAPNLPEGMAWPEALAVEDWQAVAYHLVVASGPADSTNAGLQFAELIAAHGLQKIETGE